MVVILFAANTALEVAAVESPARHRGITATVADVLPVMVDFSVDDLAFDIAHGDLF